MIYIRPDERHILETAIDPIFDALRQFECDETDIVEHIDEHVIYVLSFILQRMYKSSNDLTTALGILERVKTDYYADIVIPIQQQYAFDQSIQDITID